MQINYKPSKTFEEVHADNNFIKCVLGPLGSGKSVGCIMHLLFNAMKQVPNVQGIRKSRYAMIRDTYPSLLTTTIKTFEDWVGKLGARVKFSIPPKALLEMDLPDGTKIQSEFIFLAMDSDESTKKLRSLELTGAFMNEATDLQESVLKMLRGRVGRYPMESDGGCTNPEIIIDSNFPNVRHWLHRVFEEDRPKNHKLWKQPGGLIYDPDLEEYHTNPDAENIDYLPGKYDYYYNLAEGSTIDFINVFVLAQWGSTFEGRPVFHQFNERLHIADELLMPMRAGTTIIGMDMGLNPAAVFCQMSPSGCLNILDELSPDRVTFEEFLDEDLVPLIARKYASSPVQVVADPAGGARSSLSQLTAFDMLMQRGISVVPAHSNDILMRLEAVNHFLSRNNGLLLSRNCTIIKEGFLGGYRFEKARTGGGETNYKDKPEKNYFSHSMDALQNAALYYQRGLVKSSKPRRKAPPRKDFLYA